MGSSWSTKFRYELFAGDLVTVGGRQYTESPLVMISLILASVPE